MHIFCSNASIFIEFGEASLKFLLKKEIHIFNNRKRFFFFWFLNIIYVNSNFNKQGKKYL